MIVGAASANGDAGTSESRSAKTCCELLIGFLRRARDAALLRPLYPDLYQGYASRQAQYASDSSAVKTTVTTIHRFSKDDAIVLQGTVENETGRPIQFDGRAATVEVANEVHPIKLLDCLRPIPANATVPIDVVHQGDIDGGRANLSIQNEFRIILPAPDGMANSLESEERELVDDAVQDSAAS